MARWTEEGERLVSDIAFRYGVSTDTISLMLESILRGGGTMAQFNLNELGGGGQWMRGGMTMVGDMFNYQLKSKVDGICGELSNAVIDRQIQVVPQRTDSSTGLGNGGSWWPSELGSPNSSGSQNQYRYAFFAGARRLAISDGQNVTVYDTLDHQIGGVSQQQSGGASVSFTSQYGTVDLRSLPIVSGAGAASQLSVTNSESPFPSAFATTSEPSLSVVGQASFSDPERPFTTPPPDVERPGTVSSLGGSMGSQQSGSMSTDDAINAIERLAKLRDAGVITEDEFATKKSELLQRI